MPATSVKYAPLAPDTSIAEIPANEVTVETKARTEADWSLIRRDLTTLGKDLTRLGGKHLSQGQHLIAEELNKIRANLSDRVEHVAQQGQTQVDSALNIVRRRPMTTLLSVFAIGFGASVLLLRKKN